MKARDTRQQRLEQYGDLELGKMHACAQVRVHTKAEVVAWAGVNVENAQAAVDIGG